MQGKIIKGVAGFYYVHTADDETYACKARGIFRERGLKPLVGDNVVFSVTDEQEKEGNVEEILPRKNEIARPLAANIDQAMALFSAARPEPNLNLLDKFLVIMDARQIPCVICFNKKDLVSPEMLTSLEKIYEAARYTVISISVKEREGTEKVREILSGKTTILAGPSGVGKSSLTNLLVPQAAMETGEISQKIGRGKNTTRHTELFCVQSDTYILDTPGFSALDFGEEIQDEKEIRYHFPEFDACVDGCRFGAGCMHIGEPVCGVRKAVSDGKIAQSRYDDYRLFVRELKDRKKY